EGDCTLREVDRQTIVDVALLLLCSISASASKQCLNACYELLSPEGLDDVVVGARLQAPHSLELVSAGGQHQNGDLAEVSDPFERLPAVEVGHRHVEHDEIGRALVEGPKTRAPVLGLLH